MSDRDPRQRGTFAAAWLVGYAAATEGAGLEALVPAALSGLLGLISQGIHHPVFEVARTLSLMAGCRRLACSSSTPDCVAAVAVEADGRVELLVANLTAAELAVDLAAGSCRIPGRIDDAATAMERVEQVATGRVTLGPLAVVRIECRRY